MAGRLKGKNAVVTGASRGIGRATALALAEEGANVVLCSRGGTSGGTGSDRDIAERVADECRALGVEATAHYGDVSDFKAAEGMIRTCVDAFGRIDILCNIAGIMSRGKLPEVSESQWDRIIAVHLKGTFNLTRHVASFMIEQGFGRIINCTSQEYVGQGIGDVSYCAAKGGVVSLTYKAAAELGRYGVTCNAFAPRAQTRMIEESLEDMKAAAEAGLIPKERFQRTIKELADPSYFAAFIAYLATDAAADLNGRIFVTAGNLIGIFNAPEIVREFPRDWEKEGPWRFQDFQGWPLAKTRS